jgi:DNA-binding NarL/FixJ family response regulator
VAVFSGIETITLHSRELVKDLPLPEEVYLVLDAPRLYAFSCLPLLEGKGRALVVTSNPSPPYLRDLLELEPEGLLALPIGPEGIRQALIRVAGGQKIHLIPPLEGVMNFQP